jgi:hypothetical protein
MAIVLPQQNRNAGTYQGVFVAPAGTTRVIATILQAAADTADTTNGMDFLIEGTNDPPSIPDNSATWFTVGNPGHWQGGQAPKPGVAPAPPQVNLYSSNGVPSRLRATAITNRRWAWGLDVVTAIE